MIGIATNQLLIPQFKQIHYATDIKVTFGFAGGLLLERLKDAGNLRNCRAIEIAPFPLI